MNVFIRNASVNDAEEILNIYRYYVENTAITFEYEKPSLEEFQKRMEKTLEKYPYLVLEEDGKIMGYAYGGPFHPRAAFAWSAETTVYLVPGLEKRGYGRMLYEALETAMKSMGILNLYACIAYPEKEDCHLNNNSVDFHKHMGYKIVGDFKKCGYKFQQWYHMVWMEKVIGEHQIPQPEIKPYGGYKHDCVFDK